MNGASRYTKEAAWGADILMKLQIIHEAVDTDTLLTVWIVLVIHLRSQLSRSR